MKALRYSLFVLLFILKVFTMPALSQNNNIEEEKKIADIIYQINNKYINANSISMNLKHLIKYWGADSINNSDFTGFYKRDGNFIHSKIMEVETIQNEEIKMVIDHESKQIILAKPSEITSFPIVDIGSLLMMKKKLGMIKNAQGKNIISIDFDIAKSPVSKVLILLNELVITKIDMDILYVEEGKKLTASTSIIFSDVLFNTKIKKNEFMVDKIVQKTKNNYKLTQNYSGYTLNNLMN